MSLKIDRMQLEIIINNDQARKSLRTLEEESRRLKKELRKVPEGSDEWNRINDKLKAIKQQHDGIIKSLGIEKLSISELGQRQKELNAIMRNLDPSTKAYRDLEKQLIAIKGRQAELRGQTVKTNKVLEGLKSALPIIGIATLVSGAKQLVSNIINVRKEFEKYEAVLTNSLGSNAAAIKEMNMLKQVAAETPFSLSELTGAFVKLINYGLKPTRAELIKYGDVAASVGKGFDQYVEAIADAVTFEFERLKEFGIRAKKEGDKITFTFKEQQTVVEANSEAIKEYMASLGELQGVQGSMAAISATLGGRISNLGDAWDNLLDSLGGKSSGVFFGVINTMIDFVNMLNRALMSVKQIKEEVNQNMMDSSLKNAVQEINVITASLIKSGMEVSKAQQRGFELYKQSIENTIQTNKTLYNDASGDQKEFLKDKIDLMTQELSAVENHYKQIDAQEKIRTAKEKELAAKELEKRRKDEFEIWKKQNDIYKKLKGEELSKGSSLTYEKAINVDYRMPPEASIPDQFENPLEGMKQIYKEQQALLKKQYAEGILSQQEYNVLSESLKLGHLEQMLAISIETGNKDLELEDQINEIKIQKQQEHLQKRQQINDAIVDASLESARNVADAIFAINQNSINRQYDAQMSALNKQKEAELSNKNLTAEQKDKIEKKYQEKEAKIKTEAFRKEKNASLVQAAINGALAITKTFAYYGFTPPAWIAAAAQAVATAAQIAVIASQPVPNYAEGNYQDITTKSGSKYRAKVVSQNHPSGLYDKPTFVPGFGLFGETAQPELVFNPRDTQAIMNAPGLVNAINATLGSAVPQYARGNAREIIRESSTTVDPASIQIMAELRDELRKGIQAKLIASETYYRTHNEGADRLSNFKQKLP